jgi:hypothetical protein
VAASGCVKLALYPTSWRAQHETTPTTDQWIESCDHMGVLGIQGPSMPVHELGAAVSRAVARRGVETPRYCTQPRAVRSPWLVIPRRLIKAISLAGRSSGRRSARRSLLNKWPLRAPLCPWQNEPTRSSVQYTRILALPDPNKI